MSFVSDFIAALDGRFPFDASLTVLADHTDQSKRVRFSVAGVTANTLRTATVPDHDCTLVPRDADGSYDIDVALVAAGQAVDVAATINHATADAEGIDAHATQDTAVRTAGTVSGVKAAATSLAGDTGGTFGDHVAAGVDGGGAGPDHVGFLQTTAHDRFGGTPNVVAGGAGAASLPVVVASGSRTKNDANAGVPRSGAVSYKSGATDVTAAAIGGRSGDATYGSGDTDCNDAGGTGGESGDVSFKSGNANSTLGASGATGDATYGSGNSADAASGDVTDKSGTSGGAANTGNYAAGSGAPTGTGSSGTAYLTSGNAPDGDTGVVVAMSGNATSATGARASGEAHYGSGTSNTNGNNGGASGLVQLVSGSTDANSAHLGGDTGTVEVRSGHATSTDPGGTSGNSGTATLASGDSADGDSGNLIIKTGTAGATGHRGRAMVDTEIDALVRVEHFDDFDYYTGAAVAADNTFGDKYHRLKGADPQALRPYNVAAENGICVLEGGNADGTTANDASQLILFDPVQADSGGQLAVETKLHIDTQITDCRVMFGLTDSVALENPCTIGALDVITLVATDCACFAWDTDGVTDNWFAVAADGGAADAGNGPVGVAPVANTDQKLRIEVSADGSEIRFYIDDVLVHTLTGSFGVSPDVDLYPFIYVCGDAATHATRIVHADYLKVSKAR